MKKISILVSVIIFAFASCSTEDKMNSLAEEREAIQAAVEDFKTGIINADKDLLDNIAAEQLVYGHSSGNVQDKDAFIEEIVSKQPNDYLTIDMADQTITVSGNTAIVRHIYSSEYTSNGSTGNFRIGNMLVWQKQQGTWKLLARQAYSLPRPPQ